MSGASFVGFEQLGSDKTARLLKAKELIAYPVHAVFSNFSFCWRSRLISNGNTVVAFI